MDQFVDVLARLQSDDNEVRKAAEEIYDNVVPQERATLLLSVGKNAALDVQARNSALILLRRLIGNHYDEVAVAWDANVMAQYRELLLAGAREETDAVVRRRWADVIAEMSRGTIALEEEQAKQTWPEVLKFLFDCSKSGDDEMYHLALNIFKQHPAIFGGEQERYLPVIREMLSTALLHRTSLKIKTCAVTATTEFLKDNEDDTALVKSFAAAGPSILTVCKESLESPEAQDDNVLEALIELTGMPKVLRPHIGSLIALCMAVLDSPDQADDTKHEAMEVLVSFSENAGPSMRKEGKACIPKLVEKCLQMMVDLDEEEGWALRETDDEDDQMSNSTVGETSLDRLCIALGAKTMIQPCFDNIQRLITSQDWRHRYASLMAISAMGEGCNNLMEAILQKVVETVLPYLKDPHARVRYAACNAIGQLSTDFAPTIQRRYHVEIVAALLQALQDNEAIPRVQAHTAAALVNFSEECPKAILAPYLQPLMERLEWVLEARFKQLDVNHKMVLEQVITTIASVADAAEDAFIPYYDRVVPCLKYILENATAAEFAMLKGKTIECITLIGLAVGPAKFMPDSHPIMQLLLRNHQTLDESGEGEPTEDPTASFMIGAWARICKLMGPEFQQYLPVVMPVVMKAASHKPDVAVIEDEEKNSLEQDDWEFVPIGDQQNFGIRTTLLEDKATACQMLTCYARELKQAFAPYVEQVTHLMVPMLKFYFSDDVRTAASECMPYLLESAKVQGEDFVRQMWIFILPEMLSAIEKDSDKNCQSEHMAAFAECIEVLGAGCIDEANMIELLRILNKHLDSYFESQKERAEKRHGEDYDEEVEQELQDEDDEDEYVLSKMTDITHAMFGTHGPAFLPAFDQLLPKLQTLMMPNRSLVDLQWGICMFDDVLEYAPAESIRYQQYFMEPIARGIKANSAAVRQAAAYGLGLMGQTGHFKAPCAEAVNTLAEMINAPESRTTAREVSATENAISAIAKIIKADPEFANRDVVIAHWLAWLPTWEDGEESEHIYGFLADLIESNHPSVLEGNLPGVVKIVANAHLKGAFEECQVARMRLVNMLTMLQNNAEIYQQVSATLSAEELQGLNAFLSHQ